VGSARVLLGRLCKSADQQLKIEIADELVQLVNFPIGKDTPFKAAAQCHAGWPKGGIAEQVSIPLLALNSKDEPESEYEHFEPALKVEHHFEAFPEMVHGWLSARGDLSKENVRRDFDKGYLMMLEWFDKYL
jgi:hypothetical protein